MNKINNRIIKQTVGRISWESGAEAVRDISFLSCFIFTDSHLFSFKKFFNFSGFSTVFWFVRPDKNVIIYRSWKEYDLFAEKVGRRYLRDFKFAKQTAATLIKISDKLEKFIRDNGSLEKFFANKKIIFSLYRDFFAFHQAAFWPLEYLLRNKDPRNTRKISGITKILGKAYKYNEMIIPKVEKYFLKLKIADLSSQEIGGNLKKKTAKDRSILLLDKKIFIISAREAKKIYQALRRRRKEHQEHVGNLKGFAAYPGRIAGKVKKITRLKDFKDLRSGDILVTTQTRPQYNIFIKKVKAIITDEGGLLCHAAILAREFKIPTIVGTKFATRVLQDGMTVAIDADKGVVKIIK